MEAAAMASGTCSNRGGALGEKITFKLVGHMLRYTAKKDTVHWQLGLPSAPAICAWSSFPTYCHCPLPLPTSAAPVPYPAGVPFLQLCHLPLYPSWRNIGTLCPCHLFLSPTLANCRCLCPRSGVAPAIYLYVLHQLPLLLASGPAAAPVLCPCPPLLATAAAADSASDRLSAYRARPSGAAPPVWTGRNVWVSLGAPSAAPRSLARCQTTRLPGTAVATLRRNVVRISFAGSQSW